MGKRKTRIYQPCHSRQVTKKPFLNKWMKAKRLTFAEKHAHWSVNRWEKVLFTDESNFELFTSNRFMHVCHTKGSNQYDPKFTVKTSSILVMSWSGVCSDGTGGAVYSFCPKAKPLINTST